MELLEGTCNFCKSTGVLPSKDASKLTASIPDAFFNNDKRKTDQFAVHKKHLKLCVVCAYKLEISIDFKNKFDETSSHRAKNKPTQCFICTSSESRLVKMSTEPGELGRNMKVFVEAMLTSRIYKQNIVCLHCIFSLRVWSDTREVILEMLKSPKSQSGLTTPKKSDGMESDSDTTPRRSSKRNNNNNNGSAVVKTMSLSLKKSRKLESGTPRKSKSETSTPVQKESSVNKKQTRSKSLSPVRTKVFYKINMRKNAKNKVDSRKKKRKCEVCNKSISVLENFEKHMLNHSIVVRLPRRSLPKTTSASEFVSDESEEQQKIDDVSEIGRRRFTKNSDGGKKSDLQKRNKNKTVVDVEEISTERRRSGRNLDKSKDEDLQKKGEPSPGYLRSRDARLQKTKSATEERFKMKQKTTKKNVKGTPRCSSKRQKTLEIRDESDEESEKASEIETQEPTESTCATCSETFTRLYEYKKHLLGHEKDQSHIAVHLINYKLPQGVKASKFALLHQDRQFTARSSPSQSTIDRLLEKYIGEENQKGLNSDADAEKEESEEQEKMDVTAEEEVVDEKKVDEAPENQENGVGAEAEKEEVQEVPSAEDEQITAASENLETTTAVVHEEQEAEPAKSPDENTEATQESQTEEIKDVSMTEVEAEKAETVDTSNEKRTEIGSESTENVLVISDSDSEVNEVFSQASEATIILDNNDENEEQLEDIIAVDEEKTAEEETVTEEQQEAKNEEEIQSASKTEDTSEENANGDDDIIDSSFNYSEASASPQQQTQESEVSEIVESTPEEGSDNKTGDPVKEILETENEDAPHESTYKTAELTEDISAISDFIRDNFQDKRKRDDEEPSSPPLQVKKKVRFNLDVEESLEENNDFSLVLPSN